MHCKEQFKKLVGESGECVQISYTISPTPIKRKT